MKLISALFILALFVSACTVVKNTIQAAGPTPQSTAGLPAPTNNNGPSDGGGGIGKEGRPLESFAVDIRTLPEFKKTLLPILNDLEQRFPEFAADLWHVVLDRTWYIVPGPIKKLPAFVMGVDFIDFDQLAYQNLNEVWIDMTFFNKKMNDLDRARLMMHEMLIGVRILEFSDSLDLCLSQARIVTFSKATADQYKDNTRSCYKTYQRWGTFKPSRHLSLNENDYADVRTLGKELMTDETTLDVGELKSWLAAQGFRNYDGN